MGDEEEIIMIDTNIIIFLRKCGILKKITLFYDMAISWVSLYEFLRGLYAIGKTREEITTIKRLLEKLYTIIWPSNKTIILLTEIWNSLREKGITIDDRDLMIGILAIEHNMPLWTRNIKDFKPLEEHGLRFIEPELPDML